MCFEYSRRAGRTFIDLLAVILVLAALGAAAVPAISAARERNNRIQCAMNLRHIGQGILLYATDNKVYPRTRFDQEGKLNFYTGVKSIDPFGSEGPAVNDVTAAMFLLIRTTDLDPRTFLCPTMQLNKLPEAQQQQVQQQPPRPTSRPLGWNNNDFVAWVAKPDWKILSMSNFPGPEHLDYSMAMPYPTTKASQRGYRFSPNVVADFAIAGDINPGVDDLLKIRRDAAADQLRTIASPNHGGDGQNVLYNDGHVDWCTTPFAGAGNDNIYTAGATDEQKASLRDNSGQPIVPAAEGIEIISRAPAWDLDTVLLPVAGQKPTGQGK